MATWTMEVQHIEGDQIVIATQEKFDSRTEAEAATQNYLNDLGMRYKIASFAYQTIFSTSPEDAICVVVK